MSDVTTPQPPPPQGWYPDPEDPTRHLRWWDGYQWTLRKPMPQAGGVMANARPVGRGFARLGRVIGIGLVLVLGTSLGELALHVWGVGMIDDAIATGDLDRLELYDNLDAAMAVVYLVLLVVVAISWMVWQYQLARSTRPGDLERTPPWHAWSWLIPVANLWLPFQNVRDLWRKLLPGRATTMLGWWWAAFVGVEIASRIVAGSIDDVDSGGSFKAVVSTDAVADLLGIVAAILAIRLVRTLSRAGLAHSAADVTPAATPAG